MTDTTQTSDHARKTAADWLLGQPAIVVLLVAIIAGGCYGVRWVAIDVVPGHIKDFRAAIIAVQEANSKLLTDNEQSHREERQRAEDSSRFERSEWRKFHTDAVDRVERIVGLKSTKPAIGIPPATLQDFEPFPSKTVNRDKP